MDKTILLHLSLIEDIGPAVIDMVVKHLPEQCVLSDIYQFKMIDLVNQIGLSPKQSQAIVTGLQDQSLLEQELQLIEKHSVQWGTCYDELYPSLLKEIYRPPTILYWLGTPLHQHAKMLAAVGSRKANAYGKRVIEYIVPELVAHNFTIVSGGALGADSMVHETTLWCGGKTVAIIGSGLLKPYPKSNKKLFEKIVEHGGTIVSPFALQCDALPGNFPARNRIIAGLSHGCLVVQAAQQSGARITARFALEQGRQVFAVPGHIDDELSLGCHDLLGQGAKLVNGADDIFEELPALTEQVTSVEQEQSLSITPMSRVKPQRLYETDPLTGALLDACDKPISTDDLLEVTKLELYQLNELLFQLQLEGKIAQNIVGLWQRL